MVDKTKYLHSPPPTPNWSAAQGQTQTHCCKGFVKEEYGEISISIQIYNNNNTLHNIVSVSGWLSKHFPLLFKLLAYCFFLFFFISHIIYIQVRENNTTFTANTETIGLFVKLFKYIHLLLRQLNPSESEKFTLFTFYLLSVNF